MRNYINVSKDLVRNEIRQDNDRRKENETAEVFSIEVAKQKRAEKRARDARDKIRRELRFAE